MKEKNNCPKTKSYDPMAELKPLLFLTQQETSNYNNYLQASREEKFNFLRRIYTKSFQS